MKINDTIKSTPGVSVPQTATPTSKGADKTGGATPASTDSVRLSTQGQALASAVGGGSPVFDTQKVDRIKAAIAGGKFQVNSEKVADGLLETVRGLLNSRKR